MNNYIGGFWGAHKDTQLLSHHLGKAMEQVSPVGLFLSDNMLAWERNLSFLEDEAFMAAYKHHALDLLEKGIVWRTHIYTWCVKQALRRVGDLVDCGCYKGTSVHIACDSVRFFEQKKKFYLYDLFEHQKGMAHHSMPEHGPNLFGQVKARFSTWPQIKVIKGQVPDILVTNAPKKVAFLHLDMNQAEAELGALEFFWDRMSPGSLILLDDYGWRFYRAQKTSADRFFARHNLSVMEMPTGQGLVIV